MGRPKSHADAKRRIFCWPPHVFSWPPQVGVANSECGVAENVCNEHQLQVKIKSIHVFYLFNITKSLKNRSFLKKLHAYT